MLKIHFKREENSNHDDFNDLIGLYYMGIVTHEIVYFYVCFGILLKSENSNVQ
jgi:hypothetical protein